MKSNDLALLSYLPEVTEFDNTPLAIYIIEITREYIKFRFPRKVYESIQWDIDRIKRLFESIEISQNPIDVTSIYDSFREYMPNPYIEATFYLYQK
jgi:hypothetical protein